MSENAFTVALASLPKAASLMIEAAAVAWSSGLSLPLIIIEADGKRTVLVGDFQDDDGKRFWLSSATDSMLADGADRYGFVMEAWVAPDGAAQPRHHPQRATNFVFGGVTRESRAYLALTEDGDLSFAAAGDELGGDFFDLLPPASLGPGSRELARQRLGQRRRLGKMFELPLPGAAP